MVCIQEIKYRRIDTGALLEEFKGKIENLDLGQGDLRLSSAYSYLFEKVLFENLDFTIKDIAIDECGFVYLLGIEKLVVAENLNTEKTFILKYVENSGVLKPVGSYPEAFPLKLGKISAISVSEDTLYIADTLDGSSFRLNAFTKNDHQLRWTISKGEAGKDLEEILDIKCDEKGNIYFIEGKRVLSINKRCLFCPQTWVSCKINGFIKPDALEIDKKGNCYVLAGKRVYIFKAGEKKEVKRKIDIINIENFFPSGIAVDDSDKEKNIFVGEADKARNKSHNEKTVYKHTIQKRIICQPGPNDDWYPLWSYRGTCKKLVYDHEGRLYVLDCEGKKLTRLIRKKVNLRGPDGSFRGTYISKSVDSQEEGTVWHRLLINGNFVKGTQIEFFYFVSDTKLPEAEIIGLDTKKWRKVISETSAVQENEKRDALFRDYTDGRYLWFKIILSGTEELSPVVKSIVTFYPRASYIGYLPAIYREEPYSKDLLERFLSIFESIIYEIDDIIENIDSYFDIDSYFYADHAPPEFLSWLASWLSVPVDEGWTDEKKRLFIRNAASLYRKRGTREGLSESIELFTGVKPFIVENFQINLPCNRRGSFCCGDIKDIFFPPEGTKVKIGSKEENLVDILFGKDRSRFVFSVFLHGPEVNAEILKQVGRIIDEQKPAHTSYTLKMLEPWFYLDKHTYLEINTTLTESGSILGKTFVIGSNVLHDEEKAGQVERHSRVGIDTVLS